MNITTLSVQFQNEMYALFERKKILIIGSILFYCLAGLLTLYNAGSGYATANHVDATYFVKKQMMFILLGLIIFYILQKLSIDKLIKVTIWWWVFLCLCAVVYGSWAGFTNNGVYGWFRLLEIPFRIGDILIILYMLLLVSAYFYDQKKYSGRYFFKMVLLIQFFAWLINCYFVDRGTFVITWLVSMFLLLALGKYAASCFIASLYMGLCTLYLLTAEYGWRWLGYIREALLLNRPEDASYQLVVAIEKIISGGFWGKWDYFTLETSRLLPEAHLGFSFAYFVRDTGLVGTVLLMLILLIFLMLAMRPLRAGELTYSGLLTLAFGGLFIVECLIGMTTATGLLPANNIGMPIFSLNPIKAMAAFVAFGLLYKQLNTISTEDAEKTTVTAPIIVINVFVFILIMLKMGYHMVSGSA